MVNKFNKIKIVLISALFSLMLCFFTFAENINVSFSYGINNVVKNNISIPIELMLTNYDDKDFTGVAKINIYESNESVFVYYINVFVKSHSTDVFNDNITVSNNQNTIIIDIVNDKEEIVTTERTTIDLSQYNDRLIIGAITHDIKTLLYIDDIEIDELNLKTKLVEVNEEKFRRNKNLLNCVDILLISDINYQSFSEGFKHAINSYMSSDKLSIISLGGNNGIFSMPDPLLELLTGPSVDVVKKITIPFGNKFELKTKVTIANLRDSEQIISYGDNVFSECVKLNNGEVLTIPFSLNEFSSFGGAYEFIKTLITKSFSKSKLRNISSLSVDLLNNDYYNISNILNAIDKINLPDIFIISCFLVSYVLFCSVFLFIFLRNSGHRLLYLRLVFIFSLIFTIFMLFYGRNAMKKNVSLTYSSIVDINGPSTKETAFLNFRVNESVDFTLRTNANNKMNPIIKSKNEAIMSSNFIDINKTKTTEIMKNNGEYIINVINPKDFDSNLFLYENSNYLNDIYNVDVSLSRFDNKVSGRVTNKMGVSIQNGYIVLFGKVVKLGTINPNTSISLNRASDIGVPVGNNQVLSEIIGSTDDSIVKYYLDEKITGYFDEGYFLGFIDNNGTIDIKSNDVGNVYGKTLLVKKVKLDNESIFNDICILNIEPRNVFGNYDYDTNCIYGDSDVILEYSIDKNALVSSIYFEDIESYDHGKIESSIPFYGEMQIYNYNTGAFDNLTNKKISFEDLKNYLSVDNKFIIRYYQVTRDPMYRKISLPIPRAIMSK